MHDILPILNNSIAIFLCWLFLSAARHKLLPVNRVYYEGIFQAYGIRQRFLEQNLALMIGVLESLIAVLIALPATRVTGAALAGLMLAGYAVLMGWQLRSEKGSIECGCSGPDGSMKIANELVFRNLMLLGLALFCFFVPQTVMDLPYWGLSVTCSMVMVSIYLSTEQLILNAQKLKAIMN